jgi:hypothetical protein
MEENNVDLKEYAAHVETITQVARQSFGAAVVEECLRDYIPIFSLSLIMLHIQDPKKPLPDMEMVLFCMAKELSTIKPKKRAVYIGKQAVVNSILDEALGLTLTIGIK